MKILAFFLFPTISLASVRVELYNQIKSNNYKLDDAYISALVGELEKSCRKLGVNPFIMAAIFRVESNYKLNAINHNTKDFGIGQVNAYHIMHSKLDAYKLLYNIEYSTYHSVRIFSWFSKTYSMPEAVMRYNCGTRKACIELPQVKLYLKKVKRFLPKSKQFLLN